MAMLEGRAKLQELRFFLDAFETTMVFSACGWEFAKNKETFGGGNRYVTTGHAVNKQFGVDVMWEVIYSKHSATIHEIERINVSYMIGPYTERDWVSYYNAK